MNNNNNLPIGLGGQFLPFQTQPPPIYAVPLELAFELRDVSVALDRAKRRERAAQMREQAFSDVFVGSDNRTYTTGATGSNLEVISSCVVFVAHIEASPPLTLKPFYAIKMEGVDKWLFISEDTYFQDSRLLSALQEFCGIKIKVLRSQKTTAVLLRQAIAAKTQPIILPFYAGWLSGENGNWQFWQFCRGSTHQGAMLEYPPRILERMNDAMIATAIEQTEPIFQVVTTPFEQFVLRAWFHISALSTLLEGLGYPISKALSIFSTDEEQHEFIRKLYGWYNDPVLSLDDNPSDFRWKLLARKDQPLLIEDRGHLKHSTENAELLKSVLGNHVVPEKPGGKNSSFPVQAAITIMTKRASSISCSPDTAVLDILPDDFDLALWQSLKHRDWDAIGYIRAFTDYTSAHISELQAALGDGYKCAVDSSEGELSRETLQMLELFVGIGYFLEDFHNDLFADCPTVQYVDDEIFDGLFGLAIQTDDRAEMLPSVGPLVAVVKKFFQQKIFFLFSTQKYVKSAESQVFYDKKALYFPKDAFCNLCSALRISRPDLLRELSGAGLLVGKRINATTSMTRLPLYDEGGNRYVKYVYAIDRSVFDVDGDPLIFEEEET